MDIVVASADLPAGAGLADGDLALRSVPVEFAPPGAMTRLDEATGRTLASAVLEGEAITASRVIASGPRDDGLLTVPIRLADPEAAGLLEPGVIVDLVIASGDGAGRVVAEAARVVAVPRALREGGLTATMRQAGSLVVVATDRRTAVALAAAGTRTGLGIVMR